MERIVLAYSGGASGSAAIRALAERHAAEVVTLTLDLGQARELTGIRERALASGAARAHVIDVREAFAADHVWPAVQAGMRGTEQYSVALAMRIIAAKLVEVAEIERADAVAHEFSGIHGGLFAANVALIDPAMIVLPIGAYVRAAVSEGAESTLWARVADLGDREPFALTRDLDACPADAAVADVDFDAGRPIRLNGIDMPLVELIENIETIAGAHGVGRCQVRTSSGERIIEAPAAVVLETAYAACEETVLDPDLVLLKRSIAAAYERVAATGAWGTPRHLAAQAFTQAVQPAVNGIVRLELHRGTCRVTDIRIRPAAPATRSTVGAH